MGFVEDGVGVGVFVGVGVGVRKQSIPVFVTDIPPLKEYGVENELTIILWDTFNVWDILTPNKFV